MDWLLRIAVTLCLATQLHAGAVFAAPLTVPATKDRDPWGLCAAAVDAAERRTGIPDRLLTAISLAESGRRHPGRRIVLAWPWTVMAEGNGQYLPTKAEAVRRVEQLQARGVRNIDVGCMQVNLRYHPDAFASLDEAFSPAANAAYAGRFLAALKTETGSWRRALGRYHSATPKYAEPYTAKVSAIWAEQRRRPTPIAEPDQATPPSGAPAGKVVAVARPEPVRLSASRPAVVRGQNRQRRTTTVADRAPIRDAAALIRFAERRREQLASWRDMQRRLAAERQLTNE